MCGLGCLVFGMSLLDLRATVFYVDALGLTFDCGLVCLVWFIVVCGFAWDWFGWVLVVLLFRRVYLIAPGFYGSDLLVVLGFCGLRLVCCLVWCVW